jgi:hypothetical protein
MNPEKLLDHAGEIEELAKQVPIAIAGTGATPRWTGRRKLMYWIRSSKRRRHNHRNHSTPRG